MEKSTDVILFEHIMRLPRQMRHALMGEGSERGNHPCHRGPHPEQGHEMRGHRPMEGGFPPRPTHHHHPQGKGPLSRERVLEVLLEYEDGARQKELTERLHLNPSTMSEMIDKLEGSGYLKRTIDASDKRATLISLTDLGHSRALEIQDEKEEKIRPLFANLTEEEKQELIRLINKLITPVEAL
ncbi:MAG: MarR family transcriptional regulator [Solobacterium sp.]|nr:MarR family transcriptional regulator [Solobacterium sp.]